ncbi:MAG: ParM/StbA family protein [Hafnia sp.]
MKRYIGCDDGYDETKIVLEDGTCLKIPSQAKAGEQTNIQLKGGESKLFTYDTAEGRYTLGNIRDTDPTSFDGYPLSAMNRVIVAHAIRSAGVKPTDEIIIASGLPLKKFYNNGQPNENLINAKIKNLLTNDVKGVSGYVPPQIIKHEVLSEGIAAWMDHVLSEDANGRLYFDPDQVGMRMAFIDIGGRTTDIAVIRGGELEMNRSDTIEVGMLNVKEDFAKEILTQYGAEITSEQVREAMETGMIKLWGENVQVTEILESKLKENAMRIENASKKCLKNASDIDQVVFVGGTVNRIEPYIKDWFRNQTIGAMPGYANARGMAKFVRYMDQ